MPSHHTGLYVLVEGKKAGNDDELQLPQGEPSMGLTSEVREAQSE